MNFKGRRKIVSSFNAVQLMDKENLMTAVNDAFITHLLNKAEIDFLTAYSQGNQSILQKVKSIRPEINNKLVINHASMITRMITGYFLGTPVQYVQSGADKKDEIEYLNKIVNYEDKAAVDKEIAEQQSICGTAYRIIYTDGVYGDDVPFEDRSLDPSNTFVVYENNISEMPLFAVTYFQETNPLTSRLATRFYVYTDYGLHTFVSADDSTRVNEFSEHTFNEYSVGGVPIIEYPNNVWRLGDWELIIGLMDAVNSLYSGRLDDIDQTVQSLLVFINADIDTTVYDEMRQSGVVCLTNKTNDKSDVKTIVQSLDQTGMNAMAGELEELIYALIGIPDRGQRSGGGDTGAAVELRDGWADLEIVARNKELTFKRSEKMALKIMLTIMRNKQNLNLSLMDIVIKFNRNKNNNLLVKTQAYMNLITTKTLDPADCLTIVDLVSDVNDYITRGKTFWGDSFAGQMPEPKVVEVATQNTPQQQQQNQN